jgi:dienelactone hydrolase
MTSCYLQCANLFALLLRLRSRLPIRRYWALMAANFFCLCLLPGQAPYTEPRYGWRVEQGIVYGQAADYGGVERELRMDLYKPVCDFNPARPLFVIVHGGAFLRGSERDGDIVALCQSLARRGMVAASISYRLGFHLKGGSFDPGLLCNAELKCLQALDSTEVIRAVYRGMQDAKGAIRFLKARHLIDSTDVDNFYIGGGSAGGFIALYTGFLDPEEKPAACYALPDAPPPSPLFPGSCSVSSAIRARPDLGSTEGTLHQDNGYDASVRGVANFMGGMMENILPGERKPALYLYHQTDDLVVGYRHTRPFSLLRQHCEIAFAFCTPLFSSWPLVHGSFDIHGFATGLGSDAPLVHADIVNNGFPGIASCLSGNNHSIVNLEQRVGNLMGFMSPLIATIGNPGPAACPPLYAQSCTGSVVQTQVLGEPEAVSNQPYGMLALPDGNFLLALEWQGQAAVLLLNAEGDSLGLQVYGPSIGGAGSALHRLALLDDGSIIAAGQCSGCGPEDASERVVVLKIGPDLQLLASQLLGKPASCGDCLPTNKNSVLWVDGARIILASEVTTNTPGLFTLLNFSVLSHALEVQSSTVLNIRNFDRPFAIVPHQGNYVVLSNHPLSGRGVSIATFNGSGSQVGNFVPPLEGIEGYDAIASDGVILVSGRTLLPDDGGQAWVGRFYLHDRRLIDSLTLSGGIESRGLSLAPLGGCRALLATRQAHLNAAGTQHVGYVQRLRWCDAIRLEGAPDTIAPPNAFSSMIIRSMVPLDGSGYRYLVAGRQGGQARTFAHARSLRPFSIEAIAAGPSCAGDADGYISLLAEGVAPLSYSWAGSAVDAPLLEGLPAGVYTATVSDAACQSQEIQIDLPDGIALDLAVNQLGDTLVAAEANATYQWIDCSTGLPIDGAVQASFVPSQSGSYAVLLSLGNCQASSDCAIIVHAVEPDERILLARAFPNPSRGGFTLVLPWPAEAAVYDAMGRLLYRQPHTAGTHELGLDAPAGLYLLVLRHATGAQVMRLWRQ